MGNLFGKNLTPKEMLRESQALLRKGIRELEREREKMQREEKKLQVEMKALAKKGQLGAAKIMAKVRRLCVCVCVCVQHIKTNNVFQKPM